MSDDDGLPITTDGRLIEGLPYDFLAVNGFIYRCNKKTGEMWRLEPHPTEKKTQVWKAIEPTP